MSLIDLGNRLSLWITEAESKQLELTQRQKDLDDRSEELHRREDTIKKREREIEDAEAAQKSAKAVESEHQIQDTLNTDEKVAVYLMENKIHVTMHRDIRFNSAKTKEIADSGLILTTCTTGIDAIDPTLSFPIGNQLYRLRVAEPYGYPSNDGYVTMTLTPGDEDWTFFFVTGVDCNRTYPMRKTTIELIQNNRTMV